MKRYGLAGSGSVGRSLLSRLPKLGQELGPVASLSYRFAVRITNYLKIGTPQREMTGLNEAAVILVCAPDSGMDRLVDLLESANLDWTAKTILFCDSDTYSEDYLQFRKLGAATGSLNATEGFVNGYVIEGDQAATREAKRLVKELKGRAFELDRDRMQIYNAARTFSSSLFTPLLDSCVGCIRDAGIKGPLATQVAEAMFLRAIRTYMRAGRQSWSGPVARADRPSVEREFRELKKTRALVADYYRSSADFAFALYQTCPELTRYNRQKWTDFAERSYQP